MSSSFSYFSFCLGLQWYKSVLVLIFFSLSLSNTLISCRTVYLGRTLHVLSPSGLVRLWLCELDRNVPFACSGFLEVFGIFSVCWWVCEIGAWQPCVGHPCKISAGDGKSFTSGVSRSCNSALAWAFGDPSVFCRQFSLSSPLPQWIHSQAKCLNSSPLKGVCCQSSQQPVCLRSRRDLSNISASCGGVSMQQERWMGTWRNTLQWLKICFLNHLGRNPYQVLSNVRLGPHVDATFLLASSHCWYMSQPFDVVHDICLHTWPINASPC